MLEADKTNREEKKQKRSFDTIVKAVATGVFILSLFLNLVFIVVIILIGSALGAAKYMDSDQDGYRKVYRDSDSILSKGTYNELAVVRLQGFIADYDMNGGFPGRTENPVDALVNRLNIIKKDENIRGVLLVIESGGGAVTASDILYHEILDFKRETGLPVVTLMEQMAASGAYYLACATDYIMAYPTTITGSIGVIMFHFNVKDLMEKYGVKYIAIKSGEFKDLVSPFKGIDEEEVSWMQNIVDQMLEKFIEAVEQGRKNLSYDEVRNLADGKVYIAKDALEKGLIDEIGYFEDAISVLAQRSGVYDPRPVEFQRERHLRDIFEWSFQRLRPVTFFDILEHEKTMNPFGLYFFWDGALSPRY
jgi:protease-4